MLTGTINQDQSGPWCNGSKGLLHITQSSRTGASPSDAIKCLTQNSHGLGLFLCRGTVGVFYGTCWQGLKKEIDILNNTIKKKRIFFFYFFWWGSAFFERIILCTSLFGHLQRYKGGRGVVVIAVGNEHGDTSSNPGRDRLHFT